MKNVVRLTTNGDIITTGNVTIGNDGYPLARQRPDETREYLIDWSKYFTQTTETVTTTIKTSQLTVTKSDGTDSSTLTISAVSENVTGYVILSVDITPGEIFSIRLSIIGKELDIAT